MSESVCNSDAVVFCKTATSSLPCAFGICTEKSPSDTDTKAFFTWSIGFEIEDARNVERIIAIIMASISKITVMVFTRSEYDVKSVSGAAMTMLQSFVCSIAPNPHKIVSPLYVYVPSPALFSLISFASAFIDPCWSARLKFKIRLLSGCTIIFPFLSTRYA